MVAASEQSALSPSAVFKDRRVFVMGATGFLGKVTLAMLLHNFPHIGRVYVMVRAGSGTSSEERFWTDVVGSPVFDPLRERYGKALRGFLADKVRVVGGDITLENLGYSDAEAQALADDLDVVINSSGKVSFNPALDQSLRTNVTGTRNVIAFTKRMRRPALVHVSTCFVAGNRSGEIWESDPVSGYFPRRDELEGAAFSVEREIADCAKLSERVREEAEDAVQAATFLKAARERLRSDGRDPDNARYLKLAQARERKNWIRERLTKLGIERAQSWGWPNIYCYTKSMADQLVAQETGIVRSIVRPSIVESAIKFPFPGWNEGFTTTAPLIFLALKGQNLFLSSDTLILDLTPVDQIAGGLLSVAAAACVEQPELVYQLASGDTNPLRIRQVITLLGLHKREHFQGKTEGSRLLNEVLARMEAQPASSRRFERASVPMLNKVARRASETLARVRPRWGGERLADVIDNVQRRISRVEELTHNIGEAFDMYRPFTLENHYVFRTDHIRALQQRVPPEERHLLPWAVNRINWYDYWLDIHFPGLHKWVFPELEKDFSAKPRTVFTYNHLVELMETAAKLHPTRIALRAERAGREDRYSYRELQELATRVSGFIRQRGVGEGQRVMLVSENRPEWAMAYFGIIKAGATCVPIDKDSSQEEIVNIARSGDVSGILVSEALYAKHEGLAQRLTAYGHATPVWSFEQAFAIPSEEDERAYLAQLATTRIKSDSMASLIFTSGTTGQPKGVMLTHRNLTYMTSELSTVFDVRPTDGLLSVLPLHHTFEFSAGLLLPLAHGAQITYLPELSGESINAALQRGHTTGIVGVPALWEMLVRRMHSKLADSSPWLERSVEVLVAANSWLRQHTPLDLGALLFWPLHRRMGGRIRYLISGGSALGANAKRFFHGLSLPLLEGYGLTEASPVLTVTRPEDRADFNTVGQPLPHVELKILDPDERGVGEVVARGPTIMAGYYQDAQASAQAIVDGWLRTGDLGYLDNDRNLYLVGRSKDVIVDSNGKNVYPDELEDSYGGSEWIKELSVVGLNDGKSERVAALVVPDYEHHADLNRELVQQRVRDHFRSVSTGLPFYKRVKVLQLTDGELPRTASRKIRRTQVVARLERLQHIAESASVARVAAAGGDDDWLIDVVANVSGRPRAQINLDTSLEQLGFDSLMYTELGAAIEAAGAALPAIDDITGITDMRELATALRQPRALSIAASDSSADARPANESGQERGELHIPAFAANVGREALDRSQRWLYERVLDCHFEGQANVPSYTNFIVAPNHCSHLDTGVIKLALQDAGKNLCALAAADYFFDTRLKRAYFENFTNLVPMDRSGSLKRSLRQAVDLLQQGYNLLIFAEGTRSVSGDIEAFKASLGYLAMHARVGILPLHIWGTFEALPKGEVLLKGRKVGATVGQFLSYEALQQLTAGLSRSESYRLIAATVQQRVQALRDSRAANTAQRQQS